eukprot:gene4593-9127_t
MKNHERKSKVFVPQLMESLTVDNLRKIIEAKLPSLENQPYELRFSLPELMDRPRKFKNDDDVRSAFSQTVLKPPMQLYVENVPSLFPPSDIPYLHGMADPSDSETITMLSFYRFQNLQSPENVSYELETLWKPFKVMGRVYLAKEGVNAQMAIPTNILPNFHAACQTHALTAGLLLNTDHEMSTVEYDRTKPFSNLHIRIRDQIVADGFDEELDWSKAGREMPPLEWHEKISDPASIVLDCRNSYETDVGKFDGAIPLNTTFFRESWDALEEVLQGVPKDAPVLTYCTGGIRCVKINAYIEQKMGFTNVSRLEGGIISYARELESKFQGVNYVFDERMGARITSDVLTQCESCGSDSDLFTNCRDTNCHVRFIQCPSCRQQYDGCCSKYCQHRLNSVTTSSLSSSSVLPLSSQQRSMLTRSSPSPSPKAQSPVPVPVPANSFTPSSSAPHGLVPEDINNSEHRDASVPLTQEVGIEEDITSESEQTSSQSQDDMMMEVEMIDPLPPVKLEHATSIDDQLEALSEYCLRHSMEEPVELRLLREETNRLFPHGARMVSGHLQGRLLSTLVQICGSERVLELGTFTGYSALCLAQGLPSSGRLLSCDTDTASMELARQYCERYPNIGNKIELRTGKASDVIQQLRREDLQFDFVFIDADKKSYTSYLDALMDLKDGSESESESGSSENSSLLAENALIVVDNVLWKGLVLAEESDLKEFAPDAALYGDEKRMHQLASTMHAFNRYVAGHPLLHPVMLPLRDGLTLIRYSRNKQ